MAVLGVDACRGGWAGIVLGDDLSVHGVYAVDIGALAASAASVAEVAVIAVDMPIGLPDTGQRAADTLARRVVGPRWPSVFITPVRAALVETTYAAATMRSQAVAGGGISQQVFALRPRLFEVDEWVRLATVPVIEVHPEVSFATLASTPLAYAKKCWGALCYAVACSLGKASLSPTTWGSWVSTPGWMTCSMRRSQLGPPVGTPPASHVPIRIRHRCSATATPAPSGPDDCQSRGGRGAVVPV